MTYDLFIGDRLFSSWSLRGWLMLEKFNLPYETHLVGLYSGTMAADLAALHPARLVPVMRTPDGDTVGESLAIAETLAERHPEMEMWPTDTKLRMRARWLCAEMASGFGALRRECPMQLAHVYRGFGPSAEVVADIDRIETLWTGARDLSGSDGWLFGKYSLADVFFAPVAARIVGYDLPVSDHARSYCRRTISDPAFKQWREKGLRITYSPFPYAEFPPISAWPCD